MLTIIGCGNLNRSDDGVGVIVARRLRAWLAAQPMDGVSVLDSGTGGMEVMFQARGAKTLILVDACLSGSDPGAVFEVPGAELEIPLETGANLHGFRWNHALYAGRRIFKDAFPKDVTVYLIEARSTDFGLVLSSEVASAADLVVERLRMRIEDQGALS